ncbi:hypothetical protein EV361DRAFT_884169, partial [Lentinula raphanica]
MSQTSTSTRPKPKPRPRPVPQTASKNASASTSTAGSSSATKVTYENVQDDDEMFMRNHGKGKEGWANLRKISKEEEQNEKKIAMDKDANSDSDDSPRQSSKSKRKREYGSPLKLPRWQTDKELFRLLSEDLPDGDTDSDDGPVIIDDDDNNNSRTKRKRVDDSTRRRSKSITPPPAIPQYQLENAREAVRRTLGGHRHFSPEIDIALEEEDSFVYDPQLARIAQNVKSQSEVLGHTSSSVEPSGDDTVDITVRWEPHPLNEHGKSETWGFMLNRTDNFSELFESVAEEANVLVDRVVMTYRGTRFFSSVTPQTLSIWSNAEFVACDLPTYEYKRKRAAEKLREETEAVAQTRNLPKQNIPESNVIDLDDDDDEVELSSTTYDARVPSPPPTSQSEPHATTSGAHEDQDKFKIVLRSAQTSSDIVLNVRSTTKCGAIVKAFLNKAGLSNNYPAIFADAAGGSSTPKPKSRKSLVGVAGNIKIPGLSIDGDKVGNDTEIGVYDLEDGDMIEVVGL